MEYSLSLVLLPAGLRDDNGQLIFTIVNQVEKNMEITGNSKVAGVGAYLPKTRVTSESLMAEIDCGRFDLPLNFISRMMGIKERRVSDEHILPSDMAISASEAALRDAGTAADEIDMIIYCGIERDWQEPATAHRVQAELGAGNANCFDVTNACHGFMNGLAIADAFIATGRAENALVCTGEKPSRVMRRAVYLLKNSDNREDFRKWLGGLTVGDAGGAMIVQRSSHGSGLKWGSFRSMGEHADLCHYTHTEHGIEGQMDMGAMSKMLVGLHGEMIEDTYSHLGWTPDNVDCMYCHQVGAKPHRLLTRLAKVERAPITYDWLGNLTSAAIPVSMALNHPKKGERLLLLGAGSGVSVSQMGMVY